MINGYVNIPERLNELFTDIPETEPGTYGRTYSSKEAYDEVDKLVHSNKIPYFDLNAPLGRVFGAGIAGDIDGQLIISMSIVVVDFCTVNVGIIAAEEGHLIHVFVKYG